MSAYWQPELLEGFKPADKSFATEPESLSKCIRRENESVEAFLSRTRLQPAARISDMQTYLLGNLNNVSLVGRYSNFWENSVYVNGYAHPETIRLAYL